MSDRRLAVFLSHADPGALRLAASAALTGASMGARVDVFLFGPAVPALVEAAADADPGDPAGQLHAARGEGVRLIACSASLVDEKVPVEVADRALDAVVGWPTILEWTRDVTERFSF